MSSWYKTLKISSLSSESPLPVVNWVQPETVPPQENPQDYETQVLMNWLWKNGLTFQDIAGISILKDPAKKQQIYSKMKSSSYTLDLLKADNLAFTKESPVTLRPPLDVKFRNQVHPQDFASAVKQSKWAFYLSNLDEEHLKKCNLILSEDGTVGTAVSPEGDIMNVFNNGEQKGAAREALFEAIKKGGYTLDCYDGFLPPFYAQYGFVEVGRLKFDPKYAPPTWDSKKHGTPDVVFMALGEFNEQTTRERFSKPKSEWAPQASSGKYYSNWDEAKSASRGIRRPGIGSQK